jgi:hypothetical protein
MQCQAIAPHQTSACLQIDVTRETIAGRVGGRGIQIIAEGRRHSPVRYEVQTSRGVGPSRSLPSRGWYCGSVRRGKCGRVCGRVNAAIRSSNAGMTRAYSRHDTTEIADDQILFLLPRMERRRCSPQSCRNVHAGWYDCGRCGARNRSPLEGWPRIVAAGGDRRRSCYRSGGPWWWSGSRCRNEGWRRG